MRRVAAWIGIGTIAAGKHTKAIHTVRAFALALTAFVLAGGAYAQETWNVSTDWSDTANPNGAWSYYVNGRLAFSDIRGGEYEKPFIDPPGAPRIWTDGSHSFAGWSRSNGSENPLNSWDLRDGDVYGHTPWYGDMEIRWTSPFTGSIDVSGGVWAIRDLERSNYWRLTLNGNVLSEGYVYSGDPNGRSNPDRIEHTGLSVVVGDVLGFRAVADNTHGNGTPDYIAVNLVVTGVAPIGPVLTAHPAQLTAGMVQRSQTLVEFQLTNAGSSPTGDMQVTLPPEASWMSLVTPASIGCLNPNESVSITLLLTPNEDMSFGLYVGDLIIADSQVEKRVPYRFDYVAEPIGRLTVTAVDEYTFYAQGSPKVAGAEVTITDPYTDEVVASGVTDANGVAAFPALVADYYDVEVTAKRHGTFRTTLVISAGRETQLTAFLTRKLVTYIWKVIPTPIKDRYHFEVEADYVVNVPMPVVIIDPLMVDLCDLKDEVTQVTYTITNYGLVAAKDVRMVFRDFGGYRFEPRVIEVGDLAARSSREVSVEIQNTNFSTGTLDACADCNQCGGNHDLTYHLKCGGNDFVYTMPFFTQACCLARSDPSVTPDPNTRPCFVDCDLNDPNGGGGGGGFQPCIDCGPCEDCSDVPPGNGPYVPIPCPSCDARVRIRIDQDMVLTREAFTAVLELENNGDTLPLEKMAVTLAIFDEQGNPCEDEFYVDPPVLTGIADVNGNSAVPPGESFAAQWLIIALPQSACGEPKRYKVGGKLSYVVDGDPCEVSLYPAPITVMPSPQLEARYFLERDVYADDPFTPVIEPSIPFSLGLMMINHGCGTARDVQIVSAQPRIIENESGLLVNFKIIGAQVCPEPVAPSLKVHLGDIRSNECKVARWLMQSSLQGRFENYSVDYVHVDARGDSRLSLVEEASIHELVHVVRATCPDDGICDFLTNDVNGPDDPLNLPDTVHLSQSDPNRPVTALVYGQDQMTTLFDPLGLTVYVPDVPANGYFYARWPAPVPYDVPLKSVTRSDGKEILLDTNVWITHRTIRRQGAVPYEEHLLHLFDCEGPGEYVVRFVDPNCDFVLMDIATTPGGTVSQPGVGRFVYCPPVLVPVTAEVTDPCYCFSGWTGTAVVNGDVNDPMAARTTVTVDTDCTLQANFQLRPILDIPSSEGGTVTQPGEGRFPYDCGESVPITVAADEDYAFSHWTGTAVDTGRVDPHDTNPTLVMDDDYTLAAHFVKTHCKLMIQSDEGGHVTVPGEGEFLYECGGYAPVEAEADEGYRFTQWTGTAMDAGKVDDPCARQTTVLVDNDYTLHANFVQQRVLTVHSTPGGSVYIMVISPEAIEGWFCGPTREFDDGTVVVILTVAQPGYTFANWSGDLSDTKDWLMVTLDRDYNLKANFVASPVP